jgi:hypothetical protein
LKAIPNELLKDNPEMGDRQQQEWSGLTPFKHVCAIAQAKSDLYNGQRILSDIKNQMTTDLIRVENALSFYTKELPQLETFVASLETKVSHGLNPDQILQAGSPLHRQYVLPSPMQSALCKNWWPRNCCVFFFFHSEKVCYSPLWFHSKSIELFAESWLHMSLSSLSRPLPLSYFEFGIVVRMAGS